MCRMVFLCTILSQFLLSGCQTFLQIKLQIFIVFDRFFILQMRTLPGVI